MSKGGDSDGTDRTALHPQRPPEDVFDPSDVGGTVEEPTMQGASYLVERITPAPPVRAAREPSPLPQAPGALQEEATAAVQNPGPRPPARVEPSPASAAAVIQAAPIAAPTRALDAPPEVETAYVPLPVQPAPASPVSSDERATVMASAVRQKPHLSALVERIKSSKNARLAIIAIGGLLSMLTTVLVLSPSSPKPQAPLPSVQADPSPPVAPSQPPDKPPEPLDPARVEERDQLLERAISAFEAGRLDESLALFRRYTEEESSPAAEFMVQLLQMQISQTGREQ